MAYESTDIVAAQEVARIDRHDREAHLVPVLEQQRAVGDQPADQPGLHQEGEGQRQRRREPTASWRCLRRMPARRRPRRARWRSRR